MKRFSTNQAARKLGLHVDTLAHYVAVGKVPTPEVIITGKGKRVVHAWTEGEIEALRELLPKVANGRKTRHKKKQSAIGTKRSALSTQHSAKTKTRPEKSTRRKG